MWWFYWLSLRSYGIRPLRLVAGDKDALSALAQLDGLVIGGGDDISAEIYRGEPVPDLRIDPERDKLELAALNSAVPRDIPILGVCRGSQMLNVFFGGSLHTDIYEVYQKAPRMRTVLPRKSINIEPNTQLGDILRMARLRVNSLHHQSVENVGSGLRINARDQNDIVQGIEDASGRFRIGVQWHPEFMVYRPAHRRLFGRFIDAVYERPPILSRQLDGLTAEALPPARRQNSEGVQPSNPFWRW